MGYNGQILRVLLPSGSGDVRISGSNEKGQIVQWNGVAGEIEVGPVFTGGNFGVQPNNSFNFDNWWWKGKVDIWWNTPDAQTQYFFTNVPVDQGGLDKWVVSPDNPTGYPTD
jgi:hypothetical protein